MLHRLLPPIAVARQTQIANGRIYTSTPGNVVDVPDFDAVVLEANEWSFVSLSGPTSGRPAGTTTSPATPNPAVRALKYFDTDISKMIEFDGATWRDVANGNSV